MAVVAPTSTSVHANGLTFNVVDTGGGGEPVLLLHDSSLWRHQVPWGGRSALKIAAVYDQVPPLADAGFRAVAPDLRGFGETDRPKNVADYRLNILLKDVEGILDALSISSAHIVGHDWGAVLAWAFAAQAKHRTRSLTVISMGHPAGFFAGVAGSQQRKCAWYMLLFLYPGLADKGMLSGAPIMPPFTPTEGAQEDYKNMFAKLVRPETDTQAAAVTAGLNWYRANISPEAFMTDKLLDVANVATRTLGIWPTGDMAVLVEEQMKESGNFVDYPGTFRYERLDCPTHFASWDAPMETTALILDFLQGCRSVA